MNEKSPPPTVYPFAKFMADALYDPDDGYYSANIKTVGRGGDFSTSATLHAALGAAVKAWLNTEVERFPDIVDVIEIGLGDGSLMAEVRRRAGWFRKSPFRFHLVETSPVLRGIQSKRFGRKVNYHESIHAALEAADGRAFIYSNELVDAFPVTLVEWDEPSAEWAEIHVVKDTLFREVTRPLEIEDPLRFASSVLSHWNSRNISPRSGQRAEIHFSYRDWLRSWSSELKQGAVLTIDYGDPFPALYHRRPRGTVRGYFAHLLREGSEIYERPGHQDITADVNFTDIDNWHRACGWETDPLVTQAEWITAQVPDLLGDSPEDAARAKQILRVPGAGDAFKVLTSRVPE